MQIMKKYEFKKWDYQKVWIETMNWTMKWLWNDYEMTMKWLLNDSKFIYESRYEMDYETTCEIMIWIDYELSASSMKKYEFMYERVFFNKLTTWKCMKKYFSTSLYMKMYESSEYSIVWGVHLSRT